MEVLRKCRVCCLEATCEAELELFKTSRTCKFGRKNICKVCDSKRYRKWRQENPEKERERNREWRQENPEKCRERSRKWHRDNLEKTMLNSARCRAKKAGLPFDLKPEDIVFPECCPVLGVRLERSVGKSGPNSPSLDRIIPEKGYVKGNVAVISYRANAMKQDANIEEIEALLNWMKSIASL